MFQEQLSAKISTNGNGLPLQRPDKVSLIVEKLLQGDPDEYTMK